jgi:hypothetical protein
MSEQLYKVLDGERRPIHGGKGQWLPEGEWMPPVADIEPCARGYHVCTWGRLVRWLGPVIWEAEGRGECIVADDKQVWSEARLVRRLDNWNPRTQRLFACDCAERVLHLFEAKRPDDKRPREAIRIARLYAEGKATEDELAAARAAAWDAARSAESAVWSAAWCAAWAKVEDAAWSAAWDAERAWQTERLLWYLEGEEQ